MSSNSFSADYNVNNPPSVPGSPRLGPINDFDDVMLPEFTPRPAEATRMSQGIRPRDAIINIDEDDHLDTSFGHRRRDTGQSPVEDVCIPFEDSTEVGEDEYIQHHPDEQTKPRRRKKEWPDLEVLEEWSLEEKEELQQEGVHAKKVSEPMLIGGRLRPKKGAWSREEDEIPFRWTYFNENLDSSLRSHTISGLQQLGLSFRELFIPDPPEIDPPSSDDDDEPSEVLATNSERAATPVNGASRTTRQPSLLDHRSVDKQGSSGERTPSKVPAGSPRPKMLGQRPAFWLDIFQPTYEEMRVISRAFGIHKLTAEDIMEQEAREKIELFRNYYFVNYRTFEQDEKSNDYMSAVNMYFVVFRHGVLSFHFSQMPHPRTCSPTHPTASRASNLRP